MHIASHAIRGRIKKNLQGNMKQSISIHVNATYIDEQSKPDASQYVYAYTIRIENHGQSSAKLMSRYWRIADANNEIKEVAGDGVVGEQPKLLPGESYTYTSGVVLKTPTGTMTGYYVFNTQDNQEFHADIPMFALVQPHALH